MLMDEIKTRLTRAIKAQDRITREILRVALGEIQTAEGRGGSLTEEQIGAVLRKLIKSNEETISHCERDEQREELWREVEVLRSLLPQPMGRAAIADALSDIAEDIRGARSDGQATGIAMKHLVQRAALVEGKDVAEVVKALRS